MLFQVKSLVALTLVVAAIPFGYSAISPSTKVSGAGPTVPPSEPHLVLRGALARTGLAAPELAVAGITAPQAAQLVLLAKESEVVTQNQLAPAGEALAQARAAVAALEEAVRGGAQERLQELAAARVAAAAAEAAVESLINDVFTTATQGQPPGVVQLLRQVESNRRYKRLPLEFLVSERTEADWAALKSALTHERVCTKLGEPTNQEVMTRLAAFRAEEAVAAARTRIEANRATVEAAWNAAAVIQ
jgi:hypothetical protein